MADVRCFIAIALDDRLHHRLGQLMAELAPAMPSRAVRWVAAENIHLTLKFLGDVPAVQLGAIAEGMGRAAARCQPFAFDVGGLGCFPNPRRPSVLWVGIQENSGALAALQKAVEEEMARLGYPPEGRPFSPHLTLGRVRRECRPADWAVIGSAVTKIIPKPLGRQEVTAIRLYQSDLRPAGPIYTMLAEAPLGKRS